jgi:N-acetylglucosamine malate deacetylase 2
VLVVTAPPDDETLMAATVYKLAHSLGANVDLALLTDGSGGFDFAMVGEAYYGVDIDMEPAARQNLPALRKAELMGSGHILGVRNYFFLDQLDHHYTTNVDTVLQHVWNAEDARVHLRRIMQRVPYDFILCLAPIPSTHGHHKGASILALQVAAEMPLAERPTVLGVDIADASELPTPDGPPYSFAGLDGYPETRVDPNAPVFRFDRLQPMDEDYVTNYKLIVNWALAEHKTQGDLTGYFNKGDYEFYWYFAQNDPARLDDTRDLFRLLDENRFRR